MDAVMRVKVQMIGGSSVISAVIKAIIKDTPSVIKDSSICYEGIVL
jgi:hypothetical protein